MNFDPTKKRVVSCSFDPNHERIMVLSEELPSSSMMRVKGIWCPGEFKIDDLKDNFHPVLDPDTCEEFFQEALKNDPGN